MIKLAPSMLSADFLHLERDVELVNGHADIFHLDIMDGVFVPNISYGFPVMEAIAKKARLPMDAHLMICRPDKYIARFAKAGASMISFHLEAAESAGLDISALLEEIRSMGIKAGLVINPDIPVEMLFPYLHKADYVLIMSVFAGFGGQKFIEESYERIRKVKDEIMRSGADCLIEVDGGVSPANSAKLAECGADILVAGSAFFKAADPVLAAEQMKGIR